MIDQYIEKWSPISNLPKKGSIEAIHDDYEGFRILIRNMEGTEVLRVLFHVPLVYQRTDEGDRWNTVNKLLKLQSAMFFKVKNSKLAKWLEEESCGIHKANELDHYLIAGCNDIIEIISAVKPDLEWM